MLHRQGCHLLLSGGGYLRQETSRSTFLWIFLAITKLVSAAVMILLLGTRRSSWQFAGDQHLSRWKSISVALTPALSAQLAETLIHKYTMLDCPTGLERIEIVLLDQFSPTRLLYAIGLIPSLKEMFWRSGYPSSCQTFIELLPLRQLTRVFLHMPISVFEAAMFLARCRTVTHVTLKGICSHSQDTPLSSETLPKLAELALCDTQNILAILDSIRCPALKILDINSPVHRPYHQSWKSLRSFIKRSQSDVKCVVIQHSAKLPAVDLTGYLRVGQQFRVPYYLVTCRDAHAIAHAVMRLDDGLEPFKRFVRMPGGQEYVGMNCLSQCAGHFANICLQEVFSRSRRRQTILCAGVPVRLSTYLVDASYTPVSFTPLHLPF